MKDLPLAEIYRRIDEIFHYYGPNTDVQVTGGDPTLRAEPELLDIVRQIREKGMRPTLMTNGIKAGVRCWKNCRGRLCDIAFSCRYNSGSPGALPGRSFLNPLRQEYIDRCRGLPISVFFNTTVHERNVHEVPALCASL